MVALLTKSLILGMISLVSSDCGRRFGLYSSIRRSRRIVGGRESVPNSWPWMVVLFFNQTKLSCGGSIIKSSWVITAAHCFSKPIKNYF